MPALAPWLTILAQAGQMTRKETRRWIHWATENPSDAALAVRIFAGWASHRAYLLEHRKMVLWRRNHRIRRMLSLSNELMILADKLTEMALTKT